MRSVNNGLCSLHTHAPAHTHKQNNQSEDRPLFLFILGSRLGGRMLAKRTVSRLHARVYTHRFLQLHGSVALPGEPVKVRMPEAVCSPHFCFLIGVSQQALLGTLGAGLFRGVCPFNSSALAPAPAPWGFQRWRFKRMRDKSLISQEERLGEWLLRLGKVCGGGWRQKPTSSGRVRREG